MSIRRRRFRILFNIIISVLLIFICGSNLMSFFEHKLQDTIYQSPGLLAPEIEVIGIDDKALDMFGPFQQWDRNIMAEAVNILNSGEHKPAVIAIDVLYTGEGKNPKSDEMLGTAAAEGGNVVVASSLIFGTGYGGEKIIAGHEKPFPKLEKNSRTGIVNGIIDSDGVVRSVFLREEYNNEQLNGFAYSAYEKYTGDTLEEHIERSNEAYIIYSGEPGDYIGLSFADIFDEDFQPEIYADSVVFIGLTASGMLDSYFTPISGDTQMYGVEIHANAMGAMLSGQLKTYASSWINVCILIVIILAALLLSNKFDIRLVFVLFLLLGIGYTFIAFWILDKGVVITLFYPFFALALIYIYQLVFRFILETLEKRRIKSTFGKYMAPELIDQLVESGAADSDEVGVKKNIAVLFVDVRGFTPMTEKLKDQPDIIVSILNEYLELTSSAIFNNGGSIDKFIGDATMGLFNGFVPLDDYVYKSVLAGLEMVNGADKINKSIRERYNVDLGFGVGISCGDAIVGNLGPSFRKDYTAIGDTVNTAARLESSAGLSQVLISQEVYDIVKDRVKAESIGKISLKGKSQSADVYSVVGVK